MNNEERILKNTRISKTKRETVERHKSMLVKTFEVIEYGIGNQKLQIQAICI